MKTSLTFNDLFDLQAWTNCVLCLAFLTRFKIWLLRPFSSHSFVEEFSLLFQTDEVFLEAQIQNITTSPMFMEKVSLEPSIMYNVAELNAVSQAGER